MKIVINYNLIMNRTKLPKNKCCALIVLILLFSSKGWSQGPNAPEAASFEPLDVTDVVNLVTGDFSYTIPAINVPGPNGGYPLTLSYHSGIAMDQESSWVGLGWSLNAGAINRNVNGYPDDWNNVKAYEYYWNKGETLSQHSVDVSIPIYGITIGLGTSWGSLRGFSGSVGLGVGPVNFNVGSDGASIGVGVSKYLSVSAGINSQGYNVGVGVGTGGQFGGGLGIGYSEGGGLSGSASIYGGTDRISGKNVNSSLGITTSGAVTYGLGASLQDHNKTSKTLGQTKRAGSGGAYFSTTQQQDDTTIKQSGYTIPLIFVNYRYEKVKWWVDKLKESGVSGAIYSDNDFANVPQGVIDYCESLYGSCSYTPFSLPTACACIQANGVGYGYTGTEIQAPDYAFSDISEINYNGNSERFSILNRNPVLLNYDGYNVSGQGMSGPMSPRITKNIALINVNHDFEEADLSYYRPESSTPNATASFYFDNELVGGSLVNKVSFSNTTNPSNFDSYINEPSVPVSGNKRAGNFVEYFTFDNIPPDVKLPNNFIQPSFVKEGAIAGYRITSTDGMIYTYMLPVYSVMEKFRAYNYLDVERDAYSEKTNEAYATHWLLTSIMGPDYVDANTNGELDETDYGYWVDFEYGKWSEGMVWRTPGKGNEYSKIKGSRRYNWGLKELYYLDKISTRTHSALFVKELREDAKGVPQQFIYKDASYDYQMPSQKQLKLSKIVLIQNSKLGQINKNNVINITNEPNQAYSFTDPKINKTYDFTLNLQDNVIDTKDSYAISLEQNALQVVDFDFDYSLAQNSPNSDAGGKLTLKKLFFKGKEGVSLIPPYCFNYSDNPDWDYNNENYWGYYHQNAAAWSLDEIIFPQGTEVSIEYEGDAYDNFTNSGNYNFRDVKVNVTPSSFTISADVGNYELKEGDEIFLNYDSRFSDCVYLRDVRVQYVGRVALVEFNQSPTDFRTTYSFTLLEPQNYSYEILNTHTTVGACNQASFSIGAPIFSNINGTPLKHKNHAGIRVAAISVSDEVDTWRTTYEYGVGSVPYEPLYDFEGVANQNMLRSPNVLYDEVTVRNLNSNSSVIDEVKTVYEFITDRTIVEGVTQKLSFEVTRVPGTFNSFNDNDTRNDSYHYKDYQDIIGNLKQVSVYQSSTLLSKNTNNYAFLDESSGLVNSESTQMYKSVNPKPGNDEYIKINHLISTSYTKYPVILESSETVQGGFKEIAYTSDNRDLNSGKLLESTFIGSDGKEYKTEIIPAYIINEYANMGSKLDNPSNKNMLTQEAMSKSYIKEDGTWALIGSEIETWKPETYLTNVDVWRKHKSFTWNGETNNQGLFVGFNTDYDGFDWGIGNNQPSNSNWRQLSEVTMYDKYSMPLEVIDINGNKAATKMGDKSSKVYATGNAGYNEIFYSGAEDLNGTVFGGDVSIGTASENTSYAHTGVKSLEITSGNKGYVVSVTEGKSNKYKASLWVNYGNHLDTRLRVGSTVISHREMERAGDWVQLNFYFNVDGVKTVEVFTNGSTIYVDDFRLSPLSSNMSSYVYNEWDELTHILGANNLATRYEYDSAGRLKRISVEVIDFSTEGSGGFKPTRENEYTYKY